MAQVSPEHVTPLTIGWVVLLVASLLGISALNHIANKQKRITMKLDKNTLIGGLFMVGGAFLLYHGYKKVFQYMSMVGMALDEAGADAVGGSTGGLSSGLSKGQIGSAIGRALPKPKTHHPYIVGLTLIVVGGASLIGSLTGSLPAMIGALFVPNALVDTSGKAVAPNILQGLPATGGLTGLAIKSFL